MHRDQRGTRCHKDLQVCRQVYDVLALALAEIDDPVIDDLILARVMPAPNAGRVQVILVPSHADIDESEALARIAEFADDLREEVAAEVNRRRVPELVFRIGTVADMPC
jgi:ribosome-binding factor A